MPPLESPSVVGTHPNFNPPRSILITPVTPTNPPQGFRHLKGSFLQHSLEQHPVFMASHLTLGLDVMATAIEQLALIPSIH